MVEHGDLVMKDFRIGLVAIDSFHECGLIVEVEGQAGGVVGARTFERAARFDLQRVIDAVAVGVDPFAERVARVGRLDVLGPVASVGEDATIVLCAANQDISGLRRNDKFQWSKCDHVEWHASGEAADSVVKKIALSAIGLVCNAVLQDLLVLGGQRSLLSESPRPGLVERRLPPKAWDDEPRPRALPVRVLHVVGRFDNTDRQRQRRDRDCTDQIATMHSNLPSWTSGWSALRLPTGVLTWLPPLFHFQL